MTLAPPSAVDVAVIGAGAAGIAAARALSGHPLSVVVLEARDRIGGRAHTLFREGVALDMGCGWLHSADENPLARLAEAGGFTLDRTPPPWERQAFDHEMTPAEQAEFRAAFAAFEDRVQQAAARGQEGPASTLFDPACRWNPRMDAISGALNGARFAEVSIRDYAAYRDTEVNWRVVEGYGRLVETLGAGLPIVTGCPVARIDRSGPALRLETARGAVEARAVILTVPTDLIAAEAVRFDPPLPDLVEAAADLPLGLATKLHLTVTGAEDFPPDSQLWGRADTADTAGYHLRPFGRPMIEAWFSTDLARGLEAEGEAAFLAFAADELADLLGSAMRRRIEAVAVSLWGADPWSRGAYSHARPGRADARAPPPRPGREPHLRRRRGHRPGLLRHHPRRLAGRRAGGAGSAGGAGPGSRTRSTLIRHPRACPEDPRRRQTEHSCGRPSARTAEIWVLGARPRMTE